MKDVDATIEELRGRRFFGKLIVSVAYHFRAGDLYHVTETQALEESKIPKNGRAVYHGDNKQTD